MQGKPQNVVPAIPRVHKYYLYTIEFANRTESENAEMIDQ